MGARLLVLCAWLVSCGNPDAVRVGLVHGGGRGDGGFNDLAFAGADAAVEQYGDDLVVTEARSIGGAARRGFDLVIGVGLVYGDEAIDAAADHDDVHFAVVDGDVQADNVASLVFAEEQGSFLVGAVAALTSGTGHVGFVGGMDDLVIRRFEAGYVAGVAHVDGDVLVDVTYVGSWDDTEAAGDLGATMYEDGADVVFHAAGYAGFGVFEAADAYSDSSGSHVWGIGVDNDQYDVVPTDQREHVLTSMLKHTDRAVLEIIQAEMEGSFSGGARRFDLANGGVGVSTTGGFIDDLIDEIAALEQAIVAGEIVVPTEP